MLKIRRPLGRLIFNMGIAIPGKTVFLIETAPSFLACYVEDQQSLSKYILRHTKFEWTVLKFSSVSLLSISQVRMAFIVQQVRFSLYDIKRRVSFVSRRYIDRIYLINGGSPVFEEGVREVTALHRDISSKIVRTGLVYAIYGIHHRGPLLRLCNSI